MTPPIYERKKQEPLKAFDAFEVYRKMGSQRSLAAVARELGKTSSLIERWSAKFDWTSRCKAWSRELSRSERAAELQQAAIDGKEIAARAKAFRMRRIAAAEDVLTKVEAMFKFPLAEIIADASGKTIVKPGKWNFGTAGKLLLIADKVGREAFTDPDAKDNERRDETFDIQDYKSQK